MKMFSNDFEWIIAETKADAIKVSIKIVGQDLTDYHSPENWYECDPVEKFTLLSDDGVKTYASFRWYCEHYPEGFFASSEF